MTLLPFAVNNLFRFDVGVYELGSFTSCQGLGCSVATETRTEGGVNDRVHQLPSHLEYSHITLSRPLTQLTTTVWAWISAQARTPVPLLADLTALGPDRQPLVRWILYGVVPVRWNAPAFDTETSGAATETLEIAHNGFVESPL
ncbi:phage tail protein [Nocardia terpenica]|uniref:Phage tail protein n=1 Tax=Nocardia terpenica TaxID=455432 RepID=A0A6G9ZD35_9NOCA|nr:phage tail protein [Nocardia terpenica]QIS23525.1 phage tail protein [Nocardia terpenica]